MGKKFVGLDGLKHFWKQAKIWIAGRITGEVTARIAEVVANAPEDLDTLKEIADWISAHADSASEMNTAILANTEAISGKADKSHTHTKSEITDFPTSLPANGGTASKVGNSLTFGSKTYNGSSAQTITASDLVDLDAYQKKELTSGALIEDVVPADASASNKLVATNAIYKTLTRYWYDAGNRFIKLSNAYPTLWKTNNYIVSCRNDETYLLVCGTTDNEDIVAPQVYLLYSGTGKLATNGFYYDSTTKEIAFMTQGYNTVSVTQISGEVKDIILSELSETNPLSNPLVITPQKLVTESDMNTYAKPHIYNLSSYAYPTLQALFDELVARLKADITGDNFGICFMGTWLGKSYFEGSFFSPDGRSSYFKVTFQNPQDSKTLYTGDTGYSDVQVTYTGVA